MKKIFAFIGIAAVSAVILSSCGKSNVPSVFDDSNAFVAFNIASANIDEDSADTLRIPVTLASVAGLNERISYTVVDGTAKDGVNFTIPDASKTLSFNAENRVQYIEVVPKADGLYTGDQAFTIKLNASDNVKLGAASTCSVKINDIALGRNGWYATGVVCHNPELVCKVGEEEKNGFEVVEMTEAEVEQELARMGVDAI